MNDTTKKNDKKKVLVIGLDGGTFELINPWVKDGHLPTFEMMLKEGSHGELQSTIPPATVPAWPSFITGKNPGKHGVFDFMGTKDNKISLVSANDIDGETIWSILSKYNLKSIVVNVPCTYPPYLEMGVMISGMLTPPGKKWIHPPELAEEMESVADGYIVEYVINEAEYHRRQKDLIEKMKGISTKRFRVFNNLMDAVDWDFAMLVFRGTDQLQHSTIWNEKELLLDYYKHLDKLIGEILSRCGEEDYIFMVSDHGFGPVEKNLRINQVFYNFGFIKRKKEMESQVDAALKEIKRNKKESKRLKKIGLTREKVKTTLNKMRLEFLVGLVPERVKRCLPETNLVVDYENSTAYFGGTFGVGTNAIIINIPRDDEHYEDLRENIIKKLREIKDPETGNRVIKNVYKNEEIYHGPYLFKAPDLIFILEGGYKVSSEFGDDIIIPLKRKSGRHELNGMLAAKGHAIKKGYEIGEAVIIDIMPTILHLMNLPIPSDVDGRVLKEILEEGSDPATREVKFERAKEKDRIRKKIKFLTDKGGF